MNIFNFIFNTSTQAPQAAVTIDPIVTEYSDAVVSTGTLILVGLGIVLLVAAVAVGAIYLYKRVINFLTPLLSGAMMFLICCSLIFMVILLAISFIPGSQEFMTEHMKEYWLIIYVLLMILECVSVYVAVRVSKSTMEKKNVEYRFGEALVVGFAFYVVNLLVGQQVLYYAISESFNFILGAIALNDNGFDATATIYAQALVSQGATLEEATKTAIDGCLQYINTDGLAFLLNAVECILKGVVEIGACVMMYGVYAEKAEKKWAAYGLGFVAAFYVPRIIEVFFPMNVFVKTVIFAVLAAGCAYLTINFIKTVLADELPHFNKKDKRHTGGFGSGKNPGGSDKVKKMPKIVMPD